MLNLISKLFGRKQGIKVTMQSEGGSIKQGERFEILGLTDKGIEVRVAGKIQILSVFPKF